MIVGISNEKNFKMAQLVLVSGVSGFVGSHVARELLEQGYNVRGTATETRQSLLPYVKHEAQLSLVVVEDIEAPGAFDTAVVGTDFVLHTASPFHYNIIDAKRDLVDPAVNGTIGILKAIAAHAPTVRRVVITSSMAAIRTTTPALKEGLSEADWNTGVVAAFEQQGSVTPANIAYPASKTLAETAAWAFVRDNSTTFDLATINPPFIFGPTFHPCASTEKLNTSVKIVADFYLHNVKEINPLIAAGGVDVRDVARAHVLAMKSPAASGQRFVISSGVFTHEILVNILKTHFPDRPYPTGSTTAIQIREVNTKSKVLLGLGEYIPIEQSIVDTVKSIQSRFNV
ncbi:methylglyoxal reductase (NADPH-dependent) gre2 [Physocladia obscura]|uniref:Methylglyoxal reductase (NADPH-dependent) gre2 n=1 Tax=Physocladia obscura TaxID=109957 RepID=A0AAD5T6F1_9FUNG|nr:methylglyoxal reductase (NADPH-dependent) gre2 [Physocladia obscura]